MENSTQKTQIKSTEMHVWNVSEKRQNTDLNTKSNSGHGCNFQEGELG